MATKKSKQNLFELKLRFNDIMMQELGLDITDDDYVYDIESESILQISEKYIKYFEFENPIPRHNEIELNLLENPRLSETLVIPYLSKYCEAKNIIFHSVSQNPIEGSKKGQFVLSYMTGGLVKDFKSDEFVNESVRIFNLICKINKTTHFYDFEKFDIEIKKDKR